MKRKIFSLPTLLLVCYHSFSQSIGIGTASPNTSAALDITHTGKGLLIPRMSTQAISAIASPAKGLLVYDSVANLLMVNAGTPAAPNWQAIGTTNAWGLSGNIGTNPATQFIGSADNQPLQFRVNNIRAGELNPSNGNIYWGLRTGHHQNQHNLNVHSSIGIGTDALKMNNRSNIVAIGDSALFYNGYGNSFPTNSINNTAVGSKALYVNTLGSNNTAVGAKALTDNGGSFNTAIGSFALAHNFTGSNNVAIGWEPLLGNTTGSHNVAIGGKAMLANTTGGNNIAIGAQALSSNTTAFNNTAVGGSALDANTTGVLNTAIGSSAMGGNIYGHRNTAVGSEAMFITIASEYNTAIGFAAANTYDLGWNNTIIGANADINQHGLYNCVALGESATCTGSNQVRFGNSYTTSIGGIVGYSNLSDGRFKKNVHHNVKGLDFIMQLKPVTYQLNFAAINEKLSLHKDSAVQDASKKVNENEKTIFSGFIAQEVEQAATKTGYNFSGVEKPTNPNDFYGLRYSEFVVPLVKAVQEQQQMIDELKKQNAELQKRISDLEKRGNK